MDQRMKKADEEEGLISIQMQIRSRTDDSRQFSENLVHIPIACCVQIWSKSWSFNNTLSYFSVIQM